MKRRTTEGSQASRQAWSALTIGLCVLILAGHSYGQENIDLRAIIQETQKMSQASGEMTLVWWPFMGSKLVTESSNETLQPAEQEKEVRPGVSVVLVGVERATQWKLGRDQVMQPKDPAYEYAVVKLSLSWPAAEKVFELDSGDLQLIDAEGDSLDAQPLKVFLLMIEGDNQKHAVDLPYLIRKGRGLKSFRIGKALFDLKNVAFK